MEVTCRKQGYHSETVMVQEQFAAMALGNVILGGGIGLVVDAASGAAQEYPDKVEVWIKPVEWQSEAQQAQWMEAKAAYDAVQAEKEEMHQRTR